MHEFGQPRSLAIMLYDVNKGCDVSPEQFGGGTSVGTLGLARDMWELRLESTTLSVTRSPRNKQLVASPLTLAIPSPTKRSF